MQNGSVKLQLMQTYFYIIVNQFNNPTTLCRW